MTTCDLCLTSPDQTAAWAQRLGAVLQPGDCVLLTGQIGAGKTHLCRQLIQSLLPVPEDVPSPTFTLVQTYDTPACEIWHADLYRLSSTDEIEELGLTEAFDTAICLVEWPDRLGDLTPSDALSLTLTPAQDANTRILTLTWSAPKWDKTLHSLIR